MNFLPSLVLFFLCFFKVSLTNAQNHGFTVELIHPISPRSSFYNIIETRFERVSKILHHSINRVHYINHVFSASLNNIPESTITPYTGGAYVMSYSIGTPPFQLFGALDTASDLIWFQCNPCNPCYNQTSPIFDPSKSSTYKTIPCTSPTCKYIAHKQNCSSNKKNNCEYNMFYGDMSHSQGDLSVETLTLNSKDGSPISFPRIVIGCGYKNKFSEDGYITGVIGLGRGPLSLISQLGFSIGKKFSYCLVPYMSKTNTSSKLSFGDTSIVSGQGTVSTLLVQSYVDNIYITTLEAFSVGSKTIKLEHSSFFYGKQGNTLIDSGTTITYLPEDVYSKLESAVAALIKLKRVKDPTKELSLCYKTTFQMLEVPIIIAHFSGADVKLNALNTFYQVDSDVWCFAFGSKSPGVIFGNVAQQNFLVGFDLTKNILSFKPTDCTKH